MDVISGYVRLQKKGANYFGLCPFHNEKSPSFSVSPGKQMYYCFGCGAGGNVYTFIQEYENYTFPEAVKMLADRAGCESAGNQNIPKRRRRRKASGAGCWKSIKRRPNISISSFAPDRVKQGTGI